MSVTGRRWTGFSLANVRSPSGHRSSSVCTSSLRAVSPAIRGNGKNGITKSSKFCPAAKGESGLSLPPPRTLLKLCTHSTGTTERPAKTNGSLLFCSSPPSCSIFCASIRSVTETVGFPDWPRRFCSNPTASR